MSRIKEALVFETDEERMEWFQSLSPDEQAEVAKEAKEIVDKTIEAFRPVVEAYMAWFSKFCENLAEVGAAFAMAQANNACTGLAPTAAQDGTGEAGASQ